MGKESEHYELQALLDLDGLIFWISADHWVKFSAERVEPTDWIPHGIKYSLTLHDRNNTRVVGFDNAHAIKSKTGGRFSGRIVQWDHVHKLKRVAPYEFTSPAQLLSDFWESVHRIVGRE